MWHRARAVAERVEPAACRLREVVRIRKRARPLLDQRLDVLGEEPGGVLAGLPHVEDAEHAGLVVESRRVRDQPIERTVADLVRYEVIVRRRAIPDRELLYVRNCHNGLL